MFFNGVPNKHARFCEGKGASAREWHRLVGSRTLIDGAMLEGGSERFASRERSPTPRPTKLFGLERSFKPQKVFESAGSYRLIQNLSPMVSFKFGFEWQVAELLLARPWTTSPHIKIKSPFTVVITCAGARWSSATCGTNQGSIRRRFAPTLRPGGGVV